MSLSRRVPIAPPAAVAARPAAGARAQAPGTIRFGGRASLAGRVGGLAGADATIARTSSMPAGADCSGGGSIRIDACKIHPLHLRKGEPPSASEGARDDEKLVAAIPAEQAFCPRGEGVCPLVTT